MKRRTRLTSLAVGLTLTLLFTACQQQESQPPLEESPVADGDTSATVEEGETPAAEGDIQIKTHDAPVDDGFELSDEEINALEAIQFKDADVDAPKATIKTSKGDIEIVFYPEYAPLAVENFITHAKSGYYDGLTFHRVIEDFMIQGGDPAGNGTGGNSIYTNGSGNPIPFQNEVNLYLCHFRGALAMANSGPHTNGSQFYIVQRPDLPFTEDVLLRMGFGEEAAAYYALRENWKELLTEVYGYPENYAQTYVEHGGYPDLDGSYTVFGMVLSGMDVVDTIAAVETDGNDMPLESIIIESIIIENA